MAIFLKNLEHLVYKHKIDSEGYYTYLKPRWMRFMMFPILLFKLLQWDHKFWEFKYIIYSVNVTKTKQPCSEYTLSTSQDPNSGRTKTNSDTRLDERLESANEESVSTSVSIDSLKVYRPLLIKHLISPAACLAVSSSWGRCRHRYCPSTWWSRAFDSPTRGLSGPHWVLLCAPPPHPVSVCAAQPPDPAANCTYRRVSHWLRLSLVLCGRNSINAFDIPQPKNNVTKTKLNKLV